MQFDDRIDLARRRQFAGEIRQLPLQVVEHLRACIVGDKTEEFYAGLLAGLAVATTLVQEGLIHAVPQATAAVADFCESKEYTP